MLDMSSRITSIQERTVNRYLWPTFLILLLVMFAPAMMACWLALDGAEVANLTRLLLRRLNGILPGLSRVPTDIVSAVLQVVPILLGVLCYRPDLVQVGEQRKNGNEELRKSIPTSTKVTALVLLLVGLLCGLIGLITIDPTNASLALNVPGGKRMLDFLSAGSESAFRLSATYILMAVGFSIDIKKQAS